MATFNDMLVARWQHGTAVCVGLDTDLDLLPTSLKAQNLSPIEAFVTFNRAIIEATHDLVCAYKPNIAFYEAFGGEGLQALYRTIQYIKRVAPKVPVILDAKRGDNSNSNKGYATMAFDWLEADAITVHPYMGQEALHPFLNRKEKGVIVLAKTSNPGSAEFQDQLLPSGEPLYQYVARTVANEWNIAHNCALVVGATYPAELAKVRSLVSDLPILIPGVGAQGGEVLATVQAGKDTAGQGMIISSSRAILYASSDTDYATAAQVAAQTLRDQIQASL